MLNHPETLKWEKKLKKLFDEIDDYLEARYGETYPLHPSRAKWGTTSNKEHDGLFNVGASFTTGLGSDYGPGYVIEVRLVTLSEVSEELREEIATEVVALAQEKLTQYFPGKLLKIARDGNVYKIYGDLSLGKL
ncbi:MAG: hypothetical protein JXB88_08905 [Spirochaetales bacterium]|nr:hypothetical protein [Spirochaetales bacterium]